MQIGSTNSLVLLPGPSPVAGPLGDRVAASSSPAALPPPPDAAGVVLHLSQQASADPNLPEAPALVYTNASARADAAPAVPQAAPDGVLVAPPASEAEVKAAAFVHHAVTTMRMYAEAQERLKTASHAEDPAPAAPLIPRTLAEMQKLAARFKLFA